MLKSSDLKSLSDSLPPLSFVLEKDEQNIKSPLAQRYLNHYKINFSQSISGVRHGFGRIDIDEHQIAAHYWIPPLARGTVFIVHGYFDHVGLFNHLIRFSLQNEFAVVAFDLPGFGLSSGERATIDSFERYYRVLENCLAHFKSAAPEPWFAIGQSAGSTPLLWHLFNNGMAPFKKMVLLAPLVRSFGWQRSRWAYNFGRFFIRSLPRVFTDNSHDDDFLQFLRKDDPLQYRRLPVRWVTAMTEWMKRVEKFEARNDPVLIVQGDDDKTVDWEYNLELLKQKLPKATVKVVRQARHHLVAESAPYRAQVFAAIKAYLEAGAEREHDISNPIEVPARAVR